MGGCFDEGGLGTLFVDAASGSSVPEEAEIGCRDRNRVRASAIQLTISEAEGRSQVSSNVGQK